MGSFLQEFSKRSWTVSEQQKIVHDFLNVYSLTFTILTSSVYL